MWALVSLSLLTQAVVCVMLCLTGITIDELPVQIAFAGDNTVLTLTGIDSTNLSIGNKHICVEQLLVCVSGMWSEDCDLGLETMALVWRPWSWSGAHESWSGARDLGLEPMNLGLEPVILVWSP